MAFMVPSQAEDNFSLMIIRKKIAEGAVVQRMILTDQSNRVSFLPPLKWRTGTNWIEKKAIFQPLDFGGTISIRMLPKDEPVLPDLNNEAFLHQVLSQFHGERMITKTTYPTRYGTCITLDLERIIDADNKLLIRLVYLPAAKDWAELCLVTTPKNLEKHRPALERIIASFKSEFPVSIP
jgi:hypothetical protein